MNLIGAAAVVATGVTAGALIWSLVPPPRRLASRVRPYTAEARAALGRVPDPPPMSGSRWLRTVARLQAHDDGRLATKLDRSGLFRDVPADARVATYRTRLVATALLWSGIGAAAALVTQRGGDVVLVVLVLAGLAGAARAHGRVDSAIETRRELIRIELYTIDQLLAMHVRVGGGVVDAVRRVVERGRGEVVTELADALRAHERGLSVSDALRRAARTTAEPHAARTYSLLANAAEWGADLASGLLALADDVRDGRREALRRQATRRRAAMLVPIIGVLAPVMLLFVGAPIPNLVFGAR